MDTYGFKINKTDCYSSERVNYAYLTIIQYVGMFNNELLVGSLENSGDKTSATPRTPLTFHHSHPYSKYSPSFSSVPHIHSATAQCSSLSYAHSQSFAADCTDDFAYMGSPMLTAEKGG